MGLVVCFGPGVKDGVVFVWFGLGILNKKVHLVVFINHKDQCGNNLIFRGCVLPLFQTHSKDISCQVE